MVAKATKASPYTQIVKYVEFEWKWFWVPVDILCFESSCKMEAEGTYSFTDVPPFGEEVSVPTDSAVDARGWEFGFLFICNTPKKL